MLISTKRCIILWLGFLSLMCVYLFSNNQQASFHTFPHLSLNSHKIFAFVLFGSSFQRTVTSYMNASTLLTERTHPHKSASFKKLVRPNDGCIPIYVFHPLTVTVILLSHRREHDKLLLNGYTTFYPLHIGKTYALSRSNKAFAWTTKSSCSLVQFFSILGPASLYQWRNTFSLCVRTTTWDSYFILERRC